MRFEVYQDNAAEWRWRLLASNGRILADSGEGYQNRSDCWNVILLIRDNVEFAPMEVIG
ncbi:DUF1508 domain-containing protein [bacterium]|nr:DUF1508 domain-containing protein [bacterium]